MLRLAAPLVGIILLAAAPTASAAGEVFNGRISFTSQRDGPDFDIFTITQAGDGLRQLTANTTNDHQTDWHPDGKALAFRAEQGGRFQVWQMRADGTYPGVVVALTPPHEASQPSWFPNRAGLLMRRSGGRSPDFPGAVYRLDFPKTVPELFFSFRERQFYPSWSPDMSKVLIAMVMSEPRDTDRAIATVDPDTRQPTPIFDLPGVFDSAPAWSPDGRRIAFESDGDPLGLNPEGDREVFVMKADGTMVTQLTRNAIWDEGPAWSPDGRQIAYTSGLDNTTGDINVMTTAGVHLRRLTDFAGADESPDWQAIPAAETDRRCGDTGLAVDVRAAGRGMHCFKARRLATRWSEHGMPAAIRRFDAITEDFGGTLRVELVRTDRRGRERLVTFLHPSPN